MNLGHFQRLCSQRVKGEKTELEFLREVRKTFAPSKKETEREAREKEVMRYLYERLVDVLEDYEMTEQDLLAGQIEEWLKNPEMGSRAKVGVG